MVKALKTRTQSSSPKAPQWSLRLYITNDSPISQRAKENIKRLCHDYLAGRARCRIIDLRLNPALARAAEIVVAPTLVCMLPGRTQRVVGDLSDLPRVLMILGMGPPPPPGNTG